MKIKNSLRFVTLIVSALFVLLSSRAYSQPTNIPIGSYNKLYEYALTQVRQIYGEVYAPSIVYSSGSPSFFVGYTNNDADPVQMAALVGQQHMQFVVDPTDSIQSFVTYESQTPMVNGYVVGYGLFYGGTNFHMQKLTNGNYVVPASACSIQMEMSDWIPFPVKGIADAYIQTTDTNGNVTGYYNFADAGRLDTANGLLFLGSELTGLQGSLYIDMTNGTRLVYGLTDGNQQTTVSASTTITPVLSRVRSLPDNTSNVGYQEGDQIIRVHFTTASVVSVSFPSGLNQYPVMVYAIDSAVLEDDPMSDGLSFNPVTTAIAFKVAAGQTILIRYEYANPNPQPLNEYSDGGKG